ncbi:MAG: protein kinase, partial [Cyanobacteria bacterium]|nr:protein kinase [Cyanobacteriota bacterium]
ALDEIRTVSIRQVIFPPDRSDYAARLLCRFETEVRDTTAFTASGIARWLDVFVEQGRGFVVSEHVAGTALRNFVVDKNPMPMDKALDILIDLCDIVSSLHAEQVVATINEGFLQVRPGHGFLSPDMFVITDDGSAKMIEHPFVARIQSLSNLCPGLSYAYAAPERLTGAIVRQSDVYSLGALFYLILTGKDPSPHAVPSPVRLNPNVTPEIEQLVANMTRKRVSERMQEVEEVKFAALDARSALTLKRIPIL